MKIDTLNMLAQAVGWIVIGCSAVAGTLSILGVALDWIIKNAMTKKDVIQAINLLMEEKKKGGSK